MSSTINGWRPHCREWKAGWCHRGVHCNFKHEGFDKSKNPDKCVYCGKNNDHKQTECKVAGAPKDPKKTENWKAYRDKARAQDPNYKSPAPKKKVQFDNKDGGRRRSRSP
eukprot:1392763-Pyramimonas_sp.AAC.1